MYNYNYTTTNSISSASAAAAGTAIAGTMIFMYIMMLAVVVIQVIAMWKIFTKAGEAGWKAIIPIYNQVVLLQIVGMNPLWILGYFVPVLNIVVAIMQAINLSKSFGKGTGFAVGIIFLAPIFYLILGFDKSQYVGTKA